MMISSPLILFSVLSIFLRFNEAYSWERSHLLHRVRLRKDVVLFSSSVEIENFEKRAASNGIKAFTAKHTDFKTECCNIRGLSATSVIQKGDVVVELPIDSCLVVDSSEYRRKDNQDAAFISLYNSLDKLSNRLSLLLLNEWKKGPSSKIASYINILPFQRLTPIHWNESMLNDFPYFPLVQSVKIQKKNFTSLFSSVSSLPQFESLSYEVSNFCVRIVSNNLYTSNFSGQWKLLHQELLKVTIMYLCQSRRLLLL